MGGDATYTLQDGVITGRTGPGKNTFLTCGPFSDFELEFDEEIASLGEDDHWWYLLR